MAFLPADKGMSVQSPQGDREHGPFEDTAEGGDFCRSVPNRESQQVPVSAASRTIWPLSLKHKTEPSAVPRINNTQATAASFAIYVVFLKKSRAVILIK